MGRYFHRDGEEIVKKKSKISNTLDNTEDNDIYAVNMPELADDMAMKNWIWDQQQRRRQLKTSFMKAP